MVIVQSCAPATEPVELNDLKHYLRLSTTVTDEDDLLNSYIKLAREHVEEVTNRSLISQQWKYYLDDWPDEDHIDLPFPPLQSIANIVYFDYNASSAAFSTAYWRTDTDAEPGRVVLNYGESWPVASLDTKNPIVITFNSGYGTSSSVVPEVMKIYMKMACAYLYENRETGDIEDVPTTLLMPWRVIQF